MVSNVSANRMTFLQNGSLRHYIQLGTVMTEEGHRCQGLARRLMEQMLEIFIPVSDGIYLFGDLSALGFYEKMGFRKVNQYQYYLKKVLPWEREVPPSDLFSPRKSRSIWPPCEILPLTPLWTR